MWHFLSHTYKTFHLVAVHTDHSRWMWLMVYACSTVFTHIFRDHLCEIHPIIHDALNMWSLRHHTVFVHVNTECLFCRRVYYHHMLLTAHIYCYSLSILCMQEEHTRMHVNQPCSFNNAPNLVKVENLECLDTKTPQDMSIPTNPSKFNGVSTYSSDYAFSLLPGPMAVHRVGGDNIKVWNAKSLWLPEVQLSVCVRTCFKWHQQRLSGVIDASWVEYKYFL